MLKNCWRVLTCSMARARAKATTIRMTPTTTAPVTPAPTQAGKRGGQRLSPRFVEWLMGLPDGHVTAVPGLTRNEQLGRLGNGVVPQQAAAALRHLLEVESWTRAA